MTELHECPFCGDRWTGERDTLCCPEYAESNDDEVYLSLTPKGILVGAASDEGLTLEACLRLWDALESGCIRLLGESEASHCGLLFDGDGGAVCGVNWEEA